MSFQNFQTQAASGRLLVVMRPASIERPWSEKVRALVDRRIGHAVATLESNLAVAPPVTVMVDARRGAPELLWTAQALAQALGQSDQQSLSFCNLRDLEGSSPTGVNILSPLMYQQWRWSERRVPLVVTTDRVLVGLFSHVGLGITPQPRRSLPNGSYSLPPAEPHCFECLPNSSRLIYHRWKEPEEKRLEQA
ncbi:MAG TPA: hypothetical protein VLI05_05835 [Candidatus Saccharimonadia bacterium]|nr:hypothetical protein [Candidatus Saccharimonadia bacterium]